MTAFKVNPLKTRILHLGENLTKFIIENTPKDLIHEGMVLAITSKIVSIAERRIVSKNEVPSKQNLIEREADIFLGNIGHGMCLTITQGLFIASAGIDESNAEGDFYILYPKNSYQSAKQLWTELRQAWGLKNLGIILTDSRTTPLRRGVTGIGLSYWGFEPTQKLVGSPDLFGKPFRVTFINHVDALAGAAVYAMGEGTEPMPLCIVSGAELVFTENDHRKDLEIPLEEDLYYPILQPLLSRRDSN